jgi:hypothetical protein
VERLRARAHRREEKLLLPLGVRVERSFLHAERARKLADGRAVVALLREEPGGVTREFLTTRRANLLTLTTGR